MKKLKLGIDASALLVAQKNGYENYATSLILELVKLSAAEFSGLDITLYFYAGNQLADPKLLAYYRPALKNFKLRVYRPQTGFSKIFPWICAWDKLDWLHLPVHIWAKSYPCNIISTFHDACSKKMYQQGLIRQLPAHENDINNQIKMSKAFIAVSEQSKKDLMQYYGIADRDISVVHHGVDPDFRTLPEEVGQIKNKYDLKQYVLSVNAIQSHKNYVRLLQAFSILKQIYKIPHALVIVGRDGWGCEETYSEIERLDMGPTVRRIGFIPREDLIALYNGADLVVNASLCEGFGFPILEALACGAVVVASQNTSLQIVGGPAAIYFDPCNIEDMASVIYRGLSDEQIRTNLRNAAPQQLARFSWQKAAKETIKIYQSL